jgi:hypothetical protein
MKKKLFCDYVETNLRNTMKLNCGLSNWDDKLGTGLTNQRFVFIFRRMFSQIAIFYNKVFFINQTIKIMENRKKMFYYFKNFKNFLNF